MAQYKVTYDYTNTYEAIVTLPDDLIADMVADDEFDPECLDDVSAYIFDMCYIDPSTDKEIGWGDWGDSDIVVLKPYNPNNLAVEEIPGQEEMF